MLYGKTDTQVVMTPRIGRKPDISVHGIFMASDYAREFELRIRGFYVTDPSLFSRVRVSCGYVGKVAAVLDGAISVIYTEQPGPDRVTVIKCLLADTETFINATCNINLEAGMRLDSVLQTLTGFINKTQGSPDKAVWATPEVDSNIAGNISNAPLSWNGPIKDLMPDLKKRYPDVAISVQNNKFRAISMKDAPPLTGKLVYIKYLQSPPNYTAGRVVLTAPWEPGLSPGDTIYLMNTDFGRKDISAMTTKQKKQWTVISVQFDFSTVDSQNKMIVTGV